MTVTRLIQELQQLDGDLVVQVGGNDLATITPAVWTQEEQAANSGTLRNVVFLE